MLKIAENTYGDEMSETTNLVSQSPLNHNLTTQKKLGSSIYNIHLSVYICVTIIIVVIFLNLSGQTLISLPLRSSLFQGSSAPISMAESKSSQLTIGDGDSLILGANFTIVKKSTSCTLDDGKTTVISKCMEVLTKALPNHALGPFCSGGFWDKVIVDFSSLDITHNCQCQRDDCDNTCDDICLQCQPLAKTLTYLIPLEPIAGDNNMEAKGIYLYSTL